MFLSNDEGYTGRRSVAIFVCFSEGAGGVLFCLLEIDRYPTCGLSVYDIS